MAADHTCGNEDAFYPPLNELDHAMAAYAMEDEYQGRGWGDLEERRTPLQFPRHVSHLTTD